MLLKTLVMLHREGGFGENSAEGMHHLCTALWGFPMCYYVCVWGGVRVRKMGIPRKEWE